MKLHTPIKGIFFDIGFTLLRNVGPYWLIPNKILEYIDLETFHAIPKTASYNRAYKYLDDNHLLLSEDDELEQFKDFYSMLVRDFSDLTLTKEQIDELAYSKVYDMNNYALFDDTATTLEVLHGKYRLGIISDNFPSAVRILRHFNIEHFFETKTISSYLNTFKPDKRMYLHALEQMKLPPEQTVFVDDGEDNLDGAAKLGIQPIQIADRPGEYSSGKYPCIHKLSELLNILP